MFSQVKNRYVLFRASANSKREKKKSQGGELKKEKKSRESYFCGKQNKNFPRSLVFILLAYTWASRQCS